MRTLNKIIFINSASVQYAEMGLDGNVHLTGTQGVGKSTLLRAILFFYNANKLKLGIPREKLSFDEYYFPYQNSYIIYEVVKAEIPYCVLAYKVNGKTAFRFIDSGYQRELFIDENNRAYQNWDQIRSALGRQIHYTPLVTSYSEFRQIIYGDNKELKPLFRKYALMESKQFQNIPLTIQNVFLNSNLEATFVKDTIIKSIDEQEFEIDLENYKNNHLKDFESQINDIQIWSKTNKKGTIPIRQQAKKAIDYFRNYNFLNQEKIELAEKLASRMKFIEVEKPKLNSQINAEKNRLADLEEERKRLVNLHQKREKELYAEIKSLKKKLKEAKEKEQEYQAQNIDEIIAQVEQKDKWESQKSALQEEKSTLTAKFESVKQKYQGLIDQAQNRIGKLQNEKDSSVNKLEAEFLLRKEELRKTYDEVLDQIKADHNRQSEDFRKQIENCRNRESKIEQKKTELKYKPFFKEEFDRLQLEKESLEKERSQTKSELEKTKTEKINLRREGEFEVRELTAKFDKALEKLNNQQSEEQQKQEKLALQIQRIKTSFYGWLDENVLNWNEHIGKLIDEDVLFQSDLNPQLSSANQADFFGVDINLNALQSKVKSVDEYRQALEEVQNQIKNIQKEIHSLTQNHREETEKIQKKYRRKIGVLEENISKYEYQIEQGSRKLKANEVHFTELQNKAQLTKEKQLAECEQELNKIVSQRLRLEKEEEQVQKSRSRNLSLKNTELGKKIGEIETEKQAKTKLIEKEFEQNKKESLTRIANLEAQQMTALQDAGADTHRIAEIDLQLNEIVKQLKFIEENRDMVVEYRKDKREVFDLVPTWKATLKSQEQKQEEIKNDHRLEKQKVDQKYDNQSIFVSKLRNSLQEIETDEKAFEEFKQTDEFLEIKQYFESKEEEWENAKLAINSIQSVISKSLESNRVLNNLKQSINHFTGHFNEVNVFHFKTNFSTNEDYLAFVRNLKEFIEEDKITEFQKRVNERFAGIIQLIGKETNELTSKEAQIEKVIRKINTDFASKNFVEAIKEMELRTQKSSNRIVRLLMEIRDFNEESNLLLGEMNLFNTEGNTRQNQRAINLMTQLIKELERYRHSKLSLSESFDLQFRIVENDNDSGWVEKLTHVGSEGTDVLVKAMINILLLNVFKSDASKRFKDFKLHCMMDEIGRLHPNNVKGILRFANERNIYLINGSPISQSATDYKYTYKLSKQRSAQNAKKYLTKVNRLIKMRTKPQGS